MYYQNKWQQQLHNEDEDSDMHNILLNRITGCSTVIIKLKAQLAKDKIMKECKEYFYDKTFEDIIDTLKKFNWFCSNGVHDLLAQSVFQTPQLAQLCSLSKQWFD